MAVPQLCQTYMSRMHNAECIVHACKHFVTQPQGNDLLCTICMWSIYSDMHPYGLPLLEQTFTDMCACVQMMATLAILLGQYEVRPADCMGAWDSIQSRLMLKFVMGVSGGTNLHFVPRTA